MLASFIFNLAPQTLSSPKISPESLNYSFSRVTTISIILRNQSSDHFSNVHYGIDKNSRKEIAIKFSKNKEKIVDYDREKHILEILKNKDFYPKNIISLLRQIFLSFIKCAIKILTEKR